jgi:hypothetical protein
MADRKYNGAHNRPKAAAGSGESAPADNLSSGHLPRSVMAGPASRSTHGREHKAAGRGRADAKPAKSNAAATGSTSSRRPTASMVAHIRARLDRCVFPGCNEPSSRCQVDHTQRWSDGGETEVHNLHPICVTHHRAKDEGGWAYREVSSGLYEWTSPTGRRYVSDLRRFRTEG